MRLAIPLRKFFRSEDGPTAVEYAVMLALIVVVCLAAIQLLGGNANNMFGSVNFGGTGSSGSSSGVFAVGSSQPSGTAVSEGTWTRAAAGGGASQFESYDASSGTLTTSSAGGGNASFNTRNTGAGRLPTGSGSGDWTRLE